MWISPVQPFWILFCFSWSTTWGDKGYIKIARNSNNMCGISSEAVYPIVKSNTISTETNDD